LEQLVAHAKTIADAVRIPVIADAEAFENAVPAFEKAGVAAIHIEDHTGAGKHIADPQQLCPKEEIVARSDAFWVHRDLEDCIARLERYAEAGADMVFPTDRQATDGGEQP
jgi:methylisocitrate lyase